MSHSDPEFEAILKYTRLEKHGDTEVENVYRLQRQGEAKQMMPWKDTPNHHLLWHGTKSFNVVGLPLSEKEQKEMFVGRYLAARVAGGASRGPHHGIHVWQRSLN